jgi:hypothetical protein
MLAQTANSTLNVTALGYLLNSTSVYTTDLLSFETIYTIYMQIIPPVTI